MKKAICVVALVDWVKHALSVNAFQNASALTLTCIDLDHWITDQGDDALKRTSARNWLMYAMQKEIDCVATAITDHNTGKRVNILKSEHIGIASRNMA